jgi:hypothetical protein
VGGGGLAAILTAVAAALSFNYFHTQPYLSFDVAARQDVISVVLLGAAGVVVGEFGSRATNRARRAARLASEREDVDATLAGLALGAPVDETWADVRSLLRTYGGIDSAAFVALGHEPPDTRQADALRTYAVPVTCGRDPVGHLHVVIGSVEFDREVGALVQRAAILLGIALRAAPEVPHRLG